MIIGLNTHVSRDGNDYHVQIEDLDDKRELEVRVYLAGQIAFQKRHSYATAVEGLLNPRHIEAAVQEEMAKLFAVVKAAIIKGRIR